MAKILLVEDNELSADMLMRRLQKRGYEMHLAKDGHEAVALTKSLTPDLVLMDISLPLIDGCEATRQIKVDPLVQNIPIIALTAHALPFERARAMEAGCTDYDTKPVDLEQLLGKITAVLGKSA